MHVLHRKKCKMYFKDVISNFWIIETYIGYATEGTLNLICIMSHLNDRERRTFVRCADVVADLCLLTAPWRHLLHFARWLSLLLIYQSIFGAHWNITSHSDLETLWWTVSVKKKKKPKRWSATPSGRAGYSIERLKPQYSNNREASYGFGKMCEFSFWLRLNKYRPTS